MVGRGDGLGVGRGPGRGDGRGVGRGVGLGVGRIETFPLHAEIASLQAFVFLFTLFVIHLL